MAEQTIIDVTENIRMERVSGVAYPQTKIDGNETWNVYKRVELKDWNHLHAAPTTYTYVWERVAKGLLEEDARKFCQKLAKGKK